MKEEILQFITGELLAVQLDVDLNSDDDLLTSEIINSMGIMRLIAFLEESFQVNVPVEDVTIENFMSVDAISRYLSNRTNSFRP